MQKRSEFLHTVSNQKTGCGEGLGMRLISGLLCTVCDRKIWVSVKCTKNFPKTPNTMKVVAPSL